MFTKLNSYRITRLLLLCGVGAPIAMTILIIVAGQIDPNYSSVSDTISLLGAPNRPYSMVINIAFVIYGALICGAAYGLYRKLRYIPLTKMLVILLGVHAISAMLLGIFPSSPSIPLDIHWTDDILHNALSGISPSALLIGILVTAKIAREEEALRAVALLGLAVVVISLPLLVISVFDPLESINGLLQRLSVISSILWLSSISSVLYKNTTFLA
jgi:hypothetical membrane protein